MVSLIESSIIKSSKKVDKMTIATLTKLFVINIVARSLFGLSSKEVSRVLFRSLLFDKFSLSVGLSEKYATSEPEIRAEHAKSNNMTTKAIIASIG